MWPWAKAKLVKHSVWDPSSNELCLYLKANNPMDIDQISISSDKYVIEKSHLFYKIVDKHSRHMIFAIACEYVESISDLT